MKVFYLHTRSDTICSGSFIHTKKLSQRMISEGENAVLGIGGNGPVFDVLNDLGIPAFSIKHLKRNVNPYHDLLALFEIISILKEQKPDIISTHTTKAGWLGRLAGKILGIPVIYTPHGLSFADGVPILKRYLYLVLEKLTINFSEKIVTVCNYSKDKMKKYRVGNEKDIEVIHNGRERTKLMANTSHSPPKLVMVARFAEQKDYPTLIKSLDLVRDLDWEIDFYGDGPQKAIIQNLVDKYKLSNRVFFKGTVSNIKKHLVNYQIFLLITNWEGLPRSILDAMRVGLPVIASDVGGVDEEIINGKNGYLVSRNDYKEVAHKIRRLILNKQLRVDMGEKSKLVFKKNFTFNKMFNRTKKLYDEVYDNHK